MMGLGNLCGPAGRSWIGQGTHRAVGTGRGKLGEVRDGSGTLMEVQERLGDPRGSLRRVERPSGRSGTGQGTLGEVWDGSGTPREDLYGS